MWSVQQAKARLSEVMRLARAGDPQTIGSSDPCIVVSAEAFAQAQRPVHLGGFLVESAPTGYTLR